MTATPTPSASTPALPPRASRFRRFRLPALGLAAALAGAGTSLALGVHPKHAHEPDAHAEHHEPHPAAHVEHAPPEFVTESIPERIDLLIRCGWFKEALALCRREPAESPGDDGHDPHKGDAAGHSPADPALAYREGLCLEALGRWKDAAAAYKRAAGDDPAAAPAALGQARCAAATGDLGTARALVNRFILRSSRGEHVLEECLHLRARIDVAELGPHPAPDPLDANALAWPQLAGGLDEYSVWLPHASTPTTADAGPAVVVHRFRWVPGVFEVTARVPESPVPDILKQIGSAAELTVRIHPGTAARLAGADPVAVDVTRAPLPAVLSALTEPHGVGWRIADGALVIEPATTPDRAARREAALNAVRLAATAAPDHPTALAARVTAANLEFEAGRVRHAADGFRDFLEDFPHAALALHAGYNLGLVELGQGSLAAGRARFLEVIDRQAGKPWDALAWWWVARTHLDAGDTEAARKPLRFAAAGKSKEVASAATLAACAGHLLAGEDDAARALLTKSRLVRGETYSNTAGWLAALARYRVAPAEARGEAVHDALHEAADGLPLGPLGVFLAGRAYAESGRPDRMLAVYEAASATARGPLAVRMTFDSAEYLARIDRRTQARQRFLAVAAADPTGLGPRAELRAAELAVRDGRGAECVRWCRSAAGRPGIDTAELLVVMGRGFELEGEYRRAAACFAGRLPEE